ncbi:MAG: Bug family tripartite tricarboxylate transporter substrate binding protein [Candidatus Binatia bacterium]
MKGENVRSVAFNVEFFLVVLFVWIVSEGLAAAQTSFYHDKNLTVVAGTNPGGTADMRIRTVISFLRKHISGNPTIVVEYMPGGGGRKAANHVYRSARPDGLTIGAMLSSFVPAAVVGDSGVLYDVDRFSYLGTPYSGHPHIFLSRKGAGVSSLDQLRSAPGLRLGAQSVGHTIYYTGRMFVYLIGLKDPRFVIGYSGPELDAAFLRGEVDVRSNHPDNPIRRGWLEKGLVDVHAIIEVPKGQKHPDSRYAQLPELGSFARSDKERKLVAMHRTFQLAGAPFVLPPGTPRDRVEILQEAMRRTFKDPEFLKEYEKTGDDSPPLMPETLEKVIKELPREPEVVELFKKLFGNDPLPPRS